MQEGGDRRASKSDDQPSGLTVDVSKTNRTQFIALMNSEFGIQCPVVPSADWSREDVVRLICKLLDKPELCNVPEEFNYAGFVNAIVEDFLTQSEWDKLLANLKVYRSAEKGKFYANLLKVTTAESAHHICDHLNDLLPAPQPLTIIKRYQHDLSYYGICDLNRLTKEEFYTAFGRYFPNDGDGLPFPAIPATDWPLEDLWKFLELKLKKTLDISSVGSGFTVSNFFEGKLLEIVTSSEWESFVTSAPADYKTEFTRLSKLLSNLLPSEDFSMLSLPQLFPQPKYKAELSKFSNILAIADKAWKVSYIGLPSTKSDFMDRVSDMYENKITVSKPKKGVGVLKPFSSLAPLLQSSMFGKTKFLLEEIKYNEKYRAFVIFFLCTENPNYRNPFKRIPATAIKMLSEAINYYSSAENFGCFLYRLRNWILCAISQDGALLDKYANLGGIEFEQLFGEEDIKSLYKEENNVNRPVVTWQNKEVVITFAFDEAGELLNKFVTDNDSKTDTDKISYFKFIRRSLRHLYLTPRLPVFVSSTNSHIANFLPILVNNDGSFDRYNVYKENVDTARIGFHAPVILQETFDMFDKFARLQSQKMSAYEFLQSSYCLDYVTSLCYYGRPIWGAISQSLLKTIEEIDGATSVEAITTKAQQMSLQDMETYKNNRLLCLNFCLDMLEDKFIDLSTKTYPFGQEKEITEYESICLAVLFSTVHLKSSFRAKYGPLLIQKYLAVLYSLDVSSGTHVMGYPSEPLIAMKSSYLLKMSPETYLNSLNRIIDDGEVDLGYRGEIAFRAWLLLVNLNTLSIAPLPAHIDVAAPRRARNFLTGLVGESLVREFENCERHKGVAKTVLESLVCFNHWAKADSLPCDPDDVDCYLSVLESFAMRGAAIATPSNYKGQDACIPLISEDEALGAFGCEFKDRTVDRGQLSDIISNLCGVFLSHKIENGVLIIMIADDSVEQSIEYFSNHKYPAFVFYGFDGPFFNDPKNEKLRNVMVDLVRLGRTHSSPSIIQSDSHGLGFNCAERRKVLAERRKGRDAARGPVSEPKRKRIATDKYRATFS